MQFLKLTVVFLIAMLHSSGCCGRDIEDETASAGLLLDASYKLRQKLHLTGNLPEVALDERSMGNNITTKSSTRPVQKSTDNFWEGDGAGQEYCNYALDREGTAVVNNVSNVQLSLSKRSLAHQQRHEEKKGRHKQILYASKLERMSHQRWKHL